MNLICNTCGKPDYAPYRSYDQQGNIAEGCIDDCHTGRLVSPSSSSFWHNRPAARKHRAAVKRQQRELHKTGRLIPYAP